MTKIANAPVFPRKIARGSEEYKEWAKRYARAKRKSDKLARESSESLGDRSMKATVQLLVDIANFYKAADSSRIAIPSQLWPSFAIATRLTGSAASLEEADLLRRVTSE